MVLKCLKSVEPRKPPVCRPFCQRKIGGFRPILALVSLGRSPQHFSVGTRGGSMASEGSFTPEEISAFLETDRYNEGAIPNLEAFLDQQVDEGSHHFEANLALLKLYLVFPEKCNTARVATILRKAVAALPEPMLLQCRYLVPKAMVKNDEAIAKAIQMGKLIESGRFEQFWADGGEEFCQGMAGLRQGVNTAILGCMGRAYTEVAASQAARALNLEESELESVLKAADVETELRDGKILFLAMMRTRKHNTESTSELQSVHTLLNDLLPLAQI
eukprot:scaffold7342_cov269-Pinguiococcus_pyrenoidosus.AAC.13